MLSNSIIDSHVSEKVPLYQQMHNDFEPKETKGITKENNLGPFL